MYLLRQLSIILGYRSSIWSILENLLVYSNLQCSTLIKLKPFHI